MPDDGDGGVTLVERLHGRWARGSDHSLTTLPHFQVKSRIAAGDRDDNRGLAFASENWLLQQTEEERPEGVELDDALF